MNTTERAAPSYRPSNQAAPLGVTNNMAKQNSTTQNGTDTANTPAPAQTRVNAVELERSFGKDAAKVEYKGEFPVPETAQEMINTYGDSVVQELARQALSVRLGALVYARLKAGENAEKIQAAVLAYDPAARPARGRKGNSVSTLIKRVDKITNDADIDAAIAALQARRAALANGTTEGAPEPAATPAA